MKKLIFAVFCLASSITWAQDADEVDTEETETTVDLRVSVIENINVTAEKVPAESALEPGENISAILDEAEELEEEQVAE